MMASFSLSAAPTAATTAKAKTNSHRFKTREKQTYAFKVSCNATPTPYDDDKNQLTTSVDKQNVDRRNFILGLGGLIGTANLNSLPPAFAQTAGAKGFKIADKLVGVVKKVEDVELPVKLDQTVKVLVKRPAVKRTEEEKEKANEILMLTGVNLSSDKFVKFDVMVNAEDDETAITPADSEFAGSFASLPYKRTRSDDTTMTSGARFGLNELLEDLKAEDDEYVLVSLVPRTGCEDVTVSEIKIELVPVG